MGVESRVSLQASGTHQHLNELIVGDGGASEQHERVLGPFCHIEFKLLLPASCHTHHSRTHTTGTHTKHTTRTRRDRAPPPTYPHRQY
jgi:hypothetical protein